MTSAVDASALKGLAKSSRRLPPPPVDGNPQISGQPQPVVNETATSMVKPTENPPASPKGGAAAVAAPLVEIAADIPTVEAAAVDLPSASSPALQIPTAICPLAQRQELYGAEVTAEDARTMRGAPYQRMDGRTMRRTGRTLQLATRVTPEFDDALRTIALDEGLLIVEVLERSLGLYLHLAAQEAATGETPQAALQRLLGAGH